MTASCFHCGLPARGRFRARVLGAERAFCCAGCQAVAQTIAAAGLADYYDRRTAPAAPPPGPPLPQAPFEGDRAFLVLEGVRCSACLWLIERTLQRAPGVTEAHVNYATQRAQVQWDSGRTHLARIVEAVRAVGYDAAAYDAARAAQSRRREDRASLWRLFVAAFGAMQSMMYAFPAYVGGEALAPDEAQLMRWANLLLTLPVLAISGGPFFSGAWRDLRARRLGLDAPLALGLAGAFAASAWATFTGAGEVYFDSICMLLFLVVGARFVEQSVRRRATRALDALHGAGATAAIAPGQEYAVAPGERFAADGVLAQGATSADESLLTGEARPVPKAAGDAILGGSVNLDQPVTVKATHAPAESRAAQIARLVERAAALKPRLVEAADRAAGPLTWIIVALAAATVSWSGDAWAAIAVLVVSCPCALALGAPIVLTRASAFLLRRGVLVTRSRALETLERATDVIFDKTGTLTEGRLRVVRAWTTGAADEAECRTLAAALEATSRHPIAQAFSIADAPAAADPRYCPGRGVEGRVGGRRLRLGSREFCAELCRQPYPFSQERGVHLAGEDAWLAAFELEDRLRPQAAEAVGALRSRGLRVHLLSGDRAEAAESLARTLGIEPARGGLLPEEKYRYVSALQAAGRTCVMVGDGVNDAAVLAVADAAVAMGTGADMAQLQADVVLQSDCLSQIGESIDTSKRAMRLVRQCIGWAVAYNALALPAAALGLVGPLEAAIGMGASSLAVVLNALRPLSEGSWKPSTSSSPSPSPSYS